MPTFDVDPERITVFRVGDEYLFSHFFDREDVFESLREYYNGEEYRFEGPAEEFDAVRDRLEDGYYDPVVVEDLEPYCVVKEQYTEHAEILKQSVLSWERQGHLFFLMKDELAVDEAVERGATPIDETDYVLGCDCLQRPRVWVQGTKAEYPQVRPQRQGIAGPSLERSPPVGDRASLGVRRLSFRELPSDDPVLLTRYYFPG
jgi:hypothetical protein